MATSVHVPVSAGLMPTEARGDYLPEPPYLRETKTYHSHPLESIRHAGNYFVPLSIRPNFIFFVAEVMSNDFTTDGLKKFSLLPEAPLRPEARGICHICHMVDPALVPVSKLRVRRKVAVSWKKQSGRNDNDNEREFIQRV